MRLLTLLIVSAMAVSCAQNTKKETTTATPAKADAKKAAGTAKAAATPSAGATECKSGSDVRTLEVKANGGSHEVVYTKFGEAKSIATGGKEHCEAIKERVKGNLTNAGFTCS